MVAELGTIASLLAPVLCCDSEYYVVLTDIGGALSEKESSRGESKVISPPSRPRSAPWAWRVPHDDTNSARPSSFLSQTPPNVACLAFMNLRSGACDNCGNWSAHPAVEHRHRRRDCHLASSMNSRPPHYRSTAFQNDRVHSTESFFCQMGSGCIEGKIG